MSREQSRTPAKTRRVPPGLKAGVIDIGSNSIKLMLGEQRGALLRVVREQAFVTRLAEGMGRDRHLKPGPVAKSLEILRQCRKAADAFGAAQLAVVATSAVRGAANPEAFCAPARAILGVPVRVLSGRKEGAWTFAGITASKAWRTRKLLALDLGGGSIEFALGRGEAVSRCRSLPLGCVRVREKFGLVQPLDPERLALARAFLVREFRRVKPWTGRGSYVPVGAGGTMVTLALMLVWRDRFPGLAAVEGKKIRRKQIEGLLEALAPMTLQEVRAIPGVPHDRADIITTGLLIYAAALEALALGHVHAVTRGLRYGVWQKALAPQPVERVILPGA
jgi:exopolyphosphatase/guanosine-5'-triphosphate,3'-diphosphate pyrophosphatase